jgi:hypothetical protein
MNKEEFVLDIIERARAYPRHVFRRSDEMWPPTLFIETRAWDPAGHRWDDDVEHFDLSDFFVGNMSMKIAGQMMVPRIVSERVPHQTIMLTGGFQAGPFEAREQAEEFHAELLRRGGDIMAMPEDMRYEALLLSVVTRRMSEQSLIIVPVHRHPGALPTLGTPEEIMGQSMPDEIVSPLKQSMYGGN